MYNSILYNGLLYIFLLLESIAASIISICQFHTLLFFSSSFPLLLLRISVSSSNQKMFLSPNWLSLPSYIYIFSLCFNLHLDHQTSLVYFFHTFVLSPHLLSYHSYFISLGFTLLKYQFPVCTRFSLPFQKENMLLHIVMFVLINFPHTFHLKNSFYLLALVLFFFVSYVCNVRCSLLFLVLYLCLTLQTYATYCIK